MAEEARGDGISTAPWGAHGTNHLQVYQLEFSCVLLVIPVGKRGGGRKGGRERGREERVWG